MFLFILAINNISESLISRIDAYEKDTVNNYNGEKVRFNVIKQIDLLVKINNIAE